MNYRDVYNLMTKSAGFFDFLKANNSLGQSGQASDPQPASSWDPNMINQSGTEFSFDTTALNKQLDTSLRKHYAKLLATAYFKSTGKKLADPESKIDPRFSYIIGRAANVDPAVYSKLNQYYQENLGGWSSTGKNISPGLAADAVDMANQYPFVPLVKQPGDTKDNPKRMTVASPLRIVQD